MRRVFCDVCGRDCTQGFLSVRIYEIDADESLGGGDMHLCKDQHGQDVGCGRSPQAIRRYLQTQPIHHREHQQLHTKPSAA